MFKNPPHNWNAFKVKFKVEFKVKFEVKFKVEFEFKVKFKFELSSHLWRVIVYMLTCLQQQQQ